MSLFEIHSIETTPEGSKAAIRAVETKYHMIPNVLGVMAESPQALEAYLNLSQLFEQGSFNSVERQVILLTVSYENNCRYCMAAHTAGAKQTATPDAIIDAIRAGRPIPEPKLEILRNFTREVVDKRGLMSETDVRSFLDAGYNPRQVLEVILGVAMKTLSNYTNHIARTPLDPVFRTFEWEGKLG